ncbi:uncharacterized protein PFLUO_LOCUS4392 [Penicillium psychrofluorescens]|uniref:uncharacterized protein n=1 Tax=Penicillium psychrofluorescens TaxID=3158075 RepID=UPI003CCD9BD6
MSDGPSPSPAHLETPRKGTGMEDPGAEDNNGQDSSSDEDHFSDASEGNVTKSRPQSTLASPVPRTRVERVDDGAQHGEVPGTEAYEKRGQDAVPDELEVVPEGLSSRNRSPAGSHDRPLTAGDSPIPQTMVEKVDPDEPSYGEVPGTEGYVKRRADAVPDLVTTTSEPGSHQSPTSPSHDDTASPPIPETHLSRVDTMPTEEEAPSQPQAHHQRAPSDAQPDTVETVPDVLDSAPLSTGTTLPSRGRRKSSVRGNAVGDDGAADDFDDFVEEQDDMGDDDFGDFDDGFQEPSVAEGNITPQAPRTPPSVPPLTELTDFKSTSELLDSLTSTLDSLFPASQDLSSLPPVESISDSAAIFSTERSLSLWSQLVAPPPLQPQNWVKSRIRRLFLVSLGVPVDLDEILPASKQKKLVLPSIDLEGRSRSRARKEGETSPTDTDSPRTSTGQAGAGARQKQSRRRAPTPPPDLDLSAVGRLCATTDAALGGLTDPELKLHISELEQLTQRASAVLEFWLKRRDGLVGEKEAFEGVIENLVSHVRRVRK